MVARQARPCGSALGADDSVGCELMVAASLSAADKAGRAEIDCRPEGVYRSIVARDAAEMTADIAPGPVEIDRSRQRCLQRKISRRCRRRGQGENRRTA